MRLTLVDPTLRDLAGHNAEYARIVLREAQSAGLTARVYANARWAPQSGAAGLDAATLGWFARGLKDADAVAFSWRRRLADTPALGRAARAALRCLRAAGVLETPDVDAPLRARAQAAAGDMARLWALPDWTQDDHVFFPNATWAEAIQAAQRLAAADAPPVSADVLLRFDPPSTPAARQDLADAVRASAATGRVRWFSDTEALAQTYERITGAPFHIARIPLDHVLAAHALAGRAAVRAGDRHCVRLGYFGEARAEKGFHHLPALAAMLSRQTKNVSLVVQMSENSAAAEPAVKRAASRLRRHTARDVRIIEGALSPTDLMMEMAACDVILLPYEAKAYRWRSSGLLLQALMLGRVVVAPGGGNWLARAVSANGRDRDAVLFDPDDGAAGLGHALLCAVERARTREPVGQPEALITQAAAAAPWLGPKAWARSGRDDATPGRGDDDTSHGSAAAISRGCAA